MLYFEMGKITFFLKVEAGDSKKKYISWGDGTEIIKFMHTIHSMKIETIKTIILFFNVIFTSGRED